MNGLLNDVNTVGHNDIAWFMFVNSDLSDLSENGMSRFSVEERSKQSNDSFTMHVVAFLYLIRQALLECLVKYTTNRIDSFIS